jgi:hypothetical protein
MPTWTQEDLKRYEERTRGKAVHQAGAAEAPRGEPQRPSVDEPVGKASPEEARSGRCFIRITSRRSRLIDPRANLYGGTKYIEDACVYAGILHDDKEAFSEGDVRQEKVGKGEEESTVIEIWKL